MIKGISFLRKAGNTGAYDRLASFFRALGFAPGKGWSEEDSRGASFLAPLGNLEFVDGRFPDTSDILVEVTALDAVHQAVQSWLREQGGEQAAARLSPITETHWKSQIFTVEPEPGFSFSFWAWTGPAQRQARSSRRGSFRRRNALRNRRCPLERCYHRPPARRRSRRAPRRALFAPISRWFVSPAHGRFLLLLAPLPTGIGRRHHRPRMFAAWRNRPTTKPSTTKWPVESGSRSRKLEFPTALVFSPAKHSSRRSTAPESRPETRVLKLAAAAIEMVSLASQAPARPGTPRTSFSS